MVYSPRFINEPGCFKPRTLKIVYLPREPKGRLRQPPDERTGAGAMVTYGDLFQFVIMLCAVITLVIYIKRKK